MINKKTYVTSNAIVALFYLSKGWVAVDHHVSRNHRKITVKLEAPAAILPPYSAECEDLARDAMLDESSRDSADLVTAS